MNKDAAKILGLSIIVSTCIITFGLMHAGKNLGRSIERGGSLARSSVHVPSTITLSGPGGSSEPIRVKVVSVHE